MLLSEIKSVPAALVNELGLKPVPGSTNIECSRVHLLASETHLPSPQHMSSVICDPSRYSFLVSLCMLSAKKTKEKHFNEIRFYSDMHLF